MNKMRNVDVVMRSPTADLMYNADVDERVPVHLVVEMVRVHHQLQEALAILKPETAATTLIVTTPGKLREKLSPGLTTSADGVTINEPLESDVPMDYSVEDRMVLDRMVQNAKVMVVFK